MLCLEKVICIRIVSGEGDVLTVFRVSVDGVVSPYDAMRDR